MDNSSKLVNIRKQLGFTQERMSKALIMNRAYYSLLEVGRKEISNSVIQKLYTLLHVRPEWWEQGEEPMFAPECQEDDLTGIIEQFRSLPAQQKEFVASIIATLKRDQDTAERTR